MTRRPPQTLGDLGEDRLVSLLTRSLAQPKDVRVPIGDDCAAVAPPKAGLWELLKTDAVVEGIHFAAGENPKRVGWKALCRAVSDIAAMGGWPEHALVTVAAPPNTTVAWMRGFYAGLSKAARRFKVAIVGGETARSPGPIFANIALTGRVEPRCCVTRSGGRPGDVLYVTGLLGGSLAGKHLDFIPRLTEARWLVQHFRIHAMMDLSDGLGSDLPRLAQSSGCGFDIDLARLPRTRGTNVTQALSDGEDFELLLAISPRNCTRLEAAWRAQHPRLRLTRIGRLTESTTAPLPHGFDHFKQP